MRSGYLLYRGEIVYQTRSINSWTARNTSLQPNGAATHSTFLHRIRLVVSHRTFTFGTDRDTVYAKYRQRSDIYRHRSMRHASAQYLLVIFIQYIHSTLLMVLPCSTISQRAAPCHLYYFGFVSLQASDVSNTLQSIIKEASEKNKFVLFMVITTAVDQCSPSLHYVRTQIPARKGVSHWETTRAASCDHAISIHKVVTSPHLRAIHVRSQPALDADSMGGRGN